MAAPAEQVFSVAILRDGKEMDAIAFDGKALTFGRDSASSVALPDGSVSRQHAELSLAAGGPVLKDLGSRNGVRVNGVPRKRAILQAGDLIEIGIYKFRFRAGRATRQALRQDLSVTNAIEQTVSRRAQLPELRQERQLATVYHACFWLTECTAQEQLVEKISSLLHESLGAFETQYYSRELNLEHRVGAEGKPPLKLADFLARRFQISAEAMVIEGASIARHQRGAGQFNYLVGAVRRPVNAEEPTDFLVLMKPSDWEIFTTEDRVLLQAVCQLWARESEKIATSDALRRENTALKSSSPKSSLLGSSAALEKLRTSLARAAATKATILLEGETGSGKEVVALFAHESSPRAEKPFIKVNCAAIPDGLIESELFGHFKGAFTDAKESRKGKFHQANGGTIFLDEIGEMPPQVQAKVLRVLENSEIEPLGSEAVQKVDVRVIAATHRNLEEMVARQEFRQDLFFRLNVFSLRVPPLREHPDDIDELATHFLEQFCQENGLASLSLAADALKALKHHAWPGNVRELRNVIHRSAITCAGPLISGEEVKSVLGQPRKT